MYARGDGWLVEVADWRLTRPLVVPEELDPEGGTVLVREERVKVHPKTQRGGDGPRGELPVHEGCEETSMFSLKS